MEDKVIYFYTVTEKYGELSNFAKTGFKAEGKYWPTKVSLNLHLLEQIAKGK